MKLALVTWSFETTQGISRCVFELANRLALSHKVHVFTTMANCTPPPGVVIHVIPLRIGNFYIREWEFFLKAGCRLRRERFDLVHLHFPVWCPSDVFTCHGLARAGFNGFKRFPRDVRKHDLPKWHMLPYYLQFPLYDYSLRNRRTLITVVSEKVRREVATQYRRPPEDIRVIPNGVDLSSFHPGLSRDWRGTVRHQLGISDDRFVLLLVGNHFQHKGVRFAVEILSRLPDRAVLLVVGADNPSRIRGTKNLLDSLLRSGRLIFGPPESDIPRYFGAADMFLLPSLYESFGLVVLEAMAAGLPVIVSRTVALGDELIRDGESGFVVDWPWSIDAFVSRIRNVMEDAVLREKVGTRAREFAMEYSWGRYADMTVEAYEHVFRRGNGHNPVDTGKQRENVH